MVYEASGLSGFKNDLFICPIFVVPSLNVTTKTNLGFIPFLILCREYKNNVTTYFLKSIKTRSVLYYDREKNVVT